MRFVAGQGAVAEQLPVGTVAELLTCRDTSADWQRRGREPSGRAAGRGAAVAEMLLAWGRRRRPWKAGTATSSGKASNLPEGSTIGKTLQAGALQRRAIGKQARKEPLL